MDIIIGAGVSGISYANFTKSEYIILEKEKEIGGYCRTIKKMGMFGITLDIFSILEILILNL
ncbi:NAD(P)-binding protein [Bacteroides hominis]|uniref:NAD(P)-binding protein n=1 Tax=Bacteroides hominis TaxID=2763023 RepID=UPI00399CDC8C